MSAGTNMCSTTVRNVVPSVDTSTRRSFVAALGPSPQVFVGLTATAVTSTACGSRSVAGGGEPGCWFGGKPGAPGVVELYADQPEPWLRSIAPSTPQPNGPETSSFVAVTALPAAVDAQSFCRAPSAVTVAPSVTVTAVMNRS